MIHLKLLSSMWHNTNGLQLSRLQKWGWTWATKTNGKCLMRRMRSINCPCKKNCLKSYHQGLSYFLLKTTTLKNDWWKLRWNGNTVKPQPEVREPEELTFSYIQNVKPDYVNQGRTLEKKGYTKLKRHKFGKILTLLPNLILL